ncbi:unnamed protein product [Rhizophagus irregularis]|nr:unnamed protein product [Rhizophagus irregularis]
MQTCGVLYFEKWADAASVIDTTQNWAGTSLKWTRHVSPTYQKKKTPLERFSRSANDKKLNPRRQPSNRNRMVSQKPLTCTPENGRKAMHGYRTDCCT